MIFYWPFFDFFLESTSNADKQKIPLSWDFFRANATFRQLFKQMVKNIANLKIIDVMTRAKDAHIAGWSDLPAVFLLTRQMPGSSFNHFFEIQNNVAHASASLPVKPAAS